MTSFPLVSHGDPGAAVALRAGRIHSVADFVADVRRVADCLPARRHLVNTCADRYRFAVGLAAALVRGQVSLLPPSQTPEMLRQLEREYGPLYALTDAPQPDAPVEQVMFPAGEARGAAPAPVPRIAADRVAAIAFTSGSTGRPTAHRKSWGALARGAIGEAATFGLAPEAGATLVATVPPQHMYGLESSVLMALQGGLCLHAGRPFYAADVAAALADAKGERVLVTTPVHLRALLEEQVSLPPLRLIVCATAPLPPEMAARAEARFGAPLHEVYGFTEAGMVATRRTVQGPLWHCLPGLDLAVEDDEVRVGGGHVEAPVPFSDVVEVRDGRSFLLHGRSADMVNIAGKRTSLAYLNHQLNSIEGVRDGVFHMPEEAGDGITRPVAFAVAPGMTREALLQALRSRIDAVFLPRPLHLVDALPRNATGKLQREALVQLAREQARAADPAAITLRRHIAPDHASAPGHFPGNPILPGVVLLDEVIAAARDHAGLGRGACTVRSAKFVRPVRPGEELVITLQSRAGGGIRFECRVGEEAAVSGTLEAGA
ncbi:MAG TPA: AMP-binding protein [Burkholderiales bacterium]|nr:AMP-binding protein [Burkholderiales bacterium]